MGAWRWVWKAPGCRSHGPAVLHGSCTGARQDAASCSPPPPGPFAQGDIVSGGRGGGTSLPACSPFLPLQQGPGCWPLGSYEAAGGT